MDNPVKRVEEFKLKGKVEFEHVYFSYAGSGGEPVIKDISFICMPGETVGIIGSTGSGKSSLVNLIPRFYDVTSGTIKVDDVNIKDIDDKELRNKIALVPQKTVLFTGSVIDNIRWGKEDADLEEVEAAAKVAQAHEFVKISPEGYNTILGQGGVNFSGGQKQRVSIARALVKKPEVLILDDCTSAVDVATEEKIREALKKYSSGLTTLIIAQRITSVLATDKIIVLDNGLAVGIGTHKELMGNCEVYKDIFRSQLGKEGI
jgi:ATP-binding cassette subfamily B multidrug efflux pump